ARLHPRARADRAALRRGGRAPGHPAAAGVPAGRDCGCRRVPGLDGAQALALGRVSGPRLLHARAPADPGPGAVPVPVADPRAAAAAHAVLLRLAAALPGPAATVDHP